MARLLSIPRAGWLAACSCLLASLALAQESYVRTVESGFDPVFSGRVVDEDGRPIESASVVLRRPMPWASYEVDATRTGAGGTFTVGGAVRPYHRMHAALILDVSAPGWAPSRIENPVRTRSPYDLGEITLFRPARLRGRVEDSGGRPVAGARVHAVLGPASGPHLDHTARGPVAETDGNGVFVCSTLPPGPVTVGFSADGFRDHVAGTITLQRDSARSLLVQLEPGRTWGVRVVDADGEPLEGAWLEPPGDHRLGDGPWIGWGPTMAFWRGRRVADESGWVSLGGIGFEESFELLVGAPGHRPTLASTDLDAGQVALAPVVQVDVHASYEGRGPTERVPAEIYEVRFPRSSARSLDKIALVRDSAGVDVLAPDHWRIAWGSRECFGGEGLPDQVTVTSIGASWRAWALRDTSAPTTAMTIRAVLPRPASLSGRLVDEAGQPVEAKLGLWLSMDALGWQLFETDHDGRFELPRVDPGIEALSLLGAPGHESRLPLPSYPWKEPLELRVDRRWTRPTGTVHGRITIDGEPPGEPVLLALDDITRGHAWVISPKGLAWTDTDGRFTFSGVRDPGPYHLVPKHRASRVRSGWRDFAAEFASHGPDWPWTVDVPREGSRTVEIDFPAESVWDSVAPAPERR